MNMTLYALSGQLRELAALTDEDVPEEVLRDTLEALEGELQVKATNVARFAANVSALSDAVDEAATAMKARAERLRRRVQSLHDYIRVNMEAAGITKIESPEFTLSVVKNPPSVIIDDETKVPATFKVMPPPAPPPVAKPDKKAIADILKAYVLEVDALKKSDPQAPLPPMPVPGAHLEYGTRLKVKI